MIFVLIFIVNFTSKKIVKYLPVNKRKIINDPVHGFIKIQSTFIYDIIEHPVFQRLRRIKQLGLTSYVYPGATHSRFQHALGTAHLMGMAIQNIRLKGLKITEKEAEAANINVIIAGHISSDSLGTNLFLDELEKKGIEIIPCSGLIRVSRARK